jgi:hypothetical protein
MERLLKLIPAEVVAVYLAGKGNLPEARQSGWSYVCLALVFVVRAWGTREPGDGHEIGAPVALVSGAWAWARPRSYSSRWTDHDGLVGVAERSASDLAVFQGCRSTRLVRGSVLRRRTL